MTDDMAPVFKALADPGRRLLLDRLAERDGQTLGELCAVLPGMTRFGVMKHLGVLEGADLIGTRKAGREKRHFLNPVPIRLAHDRWISKFAAPVVGSMTALKDSLEAPMEPVDHVYSIDIKASPERVWRAIIDGDETVRYFYATRVESMWEVGAPLAYRNDDGSVAADGQVLAIDPGRSLTITFHARWDPTIEAEGPVRQTWAIAPGEADGTCRLTVTTALVPGSATEASFTGGLVFIVSNLKTYLETGAAMAA